MTVAHIPATLDFKPVQGTMTVFTAPINHNEEFVIEYLASQPQGYQWRLSIYSYKLGQRVFLHGHWDRAEAEQAARTHLGMD